MSERLTISVEDGTKAMLVELAGGERKIGAFISKLVRDFYEGRKEIVLTTKYGDSLLHMKKHSQRLREVIQEREEIYKEVQEKQQLLEEQNDLLLKELELLKNSA